MSPVSGRRFVVVGHRGAAARAPENTAASLLAGIDAGADQIEIDVGLSRDGRAVVFHDTTLDRTTTGRGPVSSRDWAEIERLDAGSFFDPRFATERPLDLDGALALVRNRVPMVVEIKAARPEGCLRPGAGDYRAVDAVAAAVLRTGGIEGVTISSSSWPLLDAMGRALPGIDLALTVGYLERRDPVEWARKIGASAVHANRRLCARRWIERAHAAGLLVVPYTVNRRGELDPLLDAGADGAFTDDPAGLRRLLRRRRPEPEPRGPLVLGIDQGSGGTRAVLVAADGAVVGSREVRVGSRRLPGGLVVQDPDAVAASVVRAAEPLLEEAPTAVAAAGMACQRSSVVIWRRSSGEAVGPVISWRSGRPAFIPDRLLAAEERVVRVTGLTPRYPYGAVRAAAAAASDPAIARGLAEGRLVAGPLGAFLAARLARGREAACDPSLAQRMLTFDLRARRWDVDLADLAGLSASSLPPVLPSVADRGALRLGGRRVPFRALVGDVGAAVRATLDEHGPLGALILGTGGFLLSCPSRRPSTAPGLLASLLWEDAAGPVYAVEGTVHGLVASLFEAARLASIDDSMPERIASRGALALRAPRVVPAVDGLGTPDWDLESRFDIEPGDWTAAELIHGTVDALAGRFGRIGDLLRKSGLLPAGLAATGGLAASPHLVTAVSSAIGVTVLPDPRPHRAAVGAAILAREGAGFPSP